MIADNCGACGQEKLAQELVAVKLGKTFLSNVKICLNCRREHNITSDYYRVAQIISEDSQLASPDVIVEPAYSLVQNAVALLRQKEPNYFSGVRKIVVSSSSQFGHVESGPGKDPAVIHVNLFKIQDEINRYQESNASEDEIVNSIAKTIAHEAGHVKSFDSELGFQGGEAPAEAEEKRMSNLIE